MILLWLALQKKLALRRYQIAVHQKVCAIQKLSLISLKIENHIDQKFDQAALKHLKFQILTKIKNDPDKNNTNIKKKWNPKSSEQRLRSY